ncbi:MAG: M56 family metallopeptidase [Bacteroidetes bacterium]|nr:M56 family metallopeptidase [Bacteroidota bacterium]
MLNLWFTMQLQTAGFILLIWLVERALPREWATPRFRYLLWMTVLVKALFPPMFSVPGAASLPAATYLSAPVEAVVLAGTPVEGTAFSLPLLLLIAILGSSCVLAGIAAYRAFALRRALKHARPFDAPPQGDWPTILVSDRIPSPLATGLRHPRIYITPAIAAAPPEILLAVLQHERAHIRRRDGLVVAFQTFVQIVYVLNPLIWLANLRLFRYRELICDEEAMASTGTRPQDYGRLLVSFAEAQPARILQTGTCFFETRRGFVQRINELFNSGSSAVMRSKHYAAVVVLSLLILPLSWRCGENSSKEADVKPPMKVESTLPVSTENYDPNKDVAAEIIGGLDALREHIVYPEAALKKNLEGIVIVNVTVKADGSTKDMKVTKSVDPILDKSALEAVRGVRFKPSTYDGKPRESTISIPIKFRLR